MRGRRAVVLAILLAGLGGCASIGGSDDAERGAAPRTLGGTDQLVPGYDGQLMAEPDRERVRLALDRNGNYEPAAWPGGQRGTTLFRVTPVRSFDGPGGSRCRDFDAQATIDGRLQKIRGTACRQPDGSWRPLSD